MTDDQPFLDAIRESPEDDAFRRAVGRFNETEFIATEEREDVCELFHQIAEAAGVTDYDVTTWQDW